MNHLAGTHSNSTPIDIDVSSFVILSPKETQPGMDNIDIGINEGVKTFIRNILLTIERVENE